MSQTFRISGTLVFFCTCGLKTFIKSKKTSNLLENPSQMADYVQYFGGHARKSMREVTRNP